MPSPSYVTNANGKVETQFDLDNINSYFTEFNNTLDTQIRTVDKTTELILSNVYSYKKTKSHNKLLFIIIIMCIIIIIISLLNKKFVIMNDNIYSGVIGIIVGFGLIYVGYSLWVFSLKDTLNYDEYNYGAFGTKNLNTLYYPSDTVSECDISNCDSSNCDISNCEVSECGVSTLQESEKTISTFFKNL